MSQSVDNFHNAVSIENILGSLWKGSK